VARVTILLGGCTAAVAVVPGVPATLLGLFAAGVCGARFTTASNTSLQLAAEPAYHGRVMALYSVLFVGTKGIGGLAAGWVAGSFGTRWGIAMGAAACLAAGTWARAALGRGTPGATTLERPPLADGAPATNPA
jgi:hypothetical protein